MRPSHEQRTILVLDPEASAFPEFYEGLRRFGTVHVYGSLDQLLGDCDAVEHPLLLLDEQALQRTPTALISLLVERRRDDPMALISARELEEYLFDLRRWGMLQVGIKTDPNDPAEVGHFLRCVCEPLAGFGLYSYLTDTVEMYSLSVSTIEEKNRGIERVINHFATANFEVHDLYDVRLVLEETLNNSFFHAFKTATGEEKYHINTFRSLAPEERIRIEYGSNGRMAGFTVTDNAGSLPIRTILTKLERQHNKDGLFDISGRGLYLSRMLTSSLVINIEAGRRTQMIALFDQRRKTTRPKPFTVNYVGPDTFGEWGEEPELD